MKKPKKITAAKPLSRRAASASSKSRAKTAKAKPVKTPAKAPVKRVRKLAAKKEEIPPAVEVKPVVKLTVAKIKPRAKTKIAIKKPLSKIEPVAKPKPLPEATPVVEIKPVLAAKPKRTIKAVKEVEPVVVKKPVVEPEPLPVIKPAAESRPALEAKPKARAKRKVSLKSPSAPVAESVVARKPVVETKPKLEEPRPVQKPISAAPAPSPKRPTPPARKAPARIPSILLEGDKPGPPHASGPGHRYALGPSAPVEKLPTEGELPESYGTNAILLTARDPHWLYAHWDLSADQQRRYNAFSRDGHLAVRIYIEAAGGKPAVEVQVHPESRHWFIHVERANTRYVAELGYYSAAEKWTVVSTSTATLTPPDAVSVDNSAEFSTIPFEVPMEKLLSLVKEAVQENPPLAQALQELRADGHAELPPVIARPLEVATAQTATPAPSRRWTKRAAWKPTEWTPAQDRALAEVISMDHVRRVWMGSLEITELIRRQLVQELVSAAAAELGAPGAPTSPSEAITGISSPTGRREQKKGFWFNVNAELIVYGATEPDATVSIGGRKIKLRPDGSFSYRFALPDGNYEMPVVAVSADETDGRAAELSFSRQTEYRGEVGAHPQDPSLQPLLVENF